MGMFEQIEENVKGRGDKLTKNCELAKGKFEEIKELFEKINDEYIEISPTPKRFVDDNLVGLMFKSYFITVELFDFAIKVEIGYPWRSGTTETWPINDHTLKEVDGLVMGAAANLINIVCHYRRKSNV